MNSDVAKVEASEDRKLKETSDLVMDDYDD